MSGVDLEGLRAFVDELSEAACDERRATVEAAIRAACDELESWRARFGFDDPEGFDIYGDREDGTISFYARPTPEELDAQRAAANERMWAVESRKRAPLWPPPPDPNEVIVVRDGVGLTRAQCEAFYGKHSEFMCWLERARGPVWLGGDVVLGKREA